VRYLRPTFFLFLFYFIFFVGLKSSKWSILAFPIICDKSKCHILVG
jgi:hypothetical protein